MPDFVTRVAVNPVKAVHLDAGGVLRVFRATVAPYDESFKQLGGGASLNARVSLSGRTVLIGQSAVGSGLGRYVGGLVPDVAFRSDGSISPIGTASWVAGVEHKVSPLVAMGAYYSGVAVSTQVLPGRGRALHRLRVSRRSNVEQPPDPGIDGHVFPAGHENGAARLRSTRRADFVAEAGALVFRGRAAVGQCLSCFSHSFATTCPDSDECARVLTCP